MKRLATCTLCEAACGIVLETDRGRVLSVRGDPDDPTSRGFVCPKVVGMQEIHEDPDRLRRPLVREGARFREASWDEAMARAASGLRRVRRRHGRDALGVYQGNPTAHNLPLLTVGQLVLRTLRTKNLYSASTADQIPHMRAAHEMFGHMVLMPVPDIDRTQLWVVVGANPMVSNGSVMTAPDVPRRIDALKARGGRLVVVDPRRTETAARADQHLFLRPGADPLFFLALLNVVFEEGLAKPGAHLAGVERLRAECKGFAPERVAAATGVAAESVRALAREIARAPSAAIYVRLGTCHQEHGTLVSWLAWSLAALTGNLDRAGGLMWTTPAVDLATLGDRLGLAGHSRFESSVRRLPEMGGELPIAALAEEIEAKNVRALLTSAGNPALSAPNGRRLERAMASLEFMVAIDPYLNETTRYANVILPPCSLLERPHYDVALNAFAVRNGAKWVDAPLERDRDARDDGEIALELGIRMRVPTRAAGGLVAKRARRAVTSERVVDLALRVGPHRLSVAKLREHPHGLDLGALEPRLPGILRTRGRKVELAPDVLVAELARVREMVDARPSELVIIGRRHLRSNNSWLHNARRLVKGPPRCTLLIHPDDASARNLAHGGRARIATPRGEVVATVEITDAIMRGVVSLPHGWGHHRDGTRMEVARAHAGVSLNDLTDDRRLDRLTGNAAFNGTEVTVEAVAVDQPSSSATTGA